MEIIVTTKTNVECDADGNVILDVNGQPKLRDEEHLGVYLRSHAIQVNQVDTATNTLQTGVIFRCEILWDKMRTPAPALEDPSDLVWLSYSTADEDDADVTDAEYEDADTLSQ